MPYYVAASLSMPVVRIGKMMVVDLWLAGLGPRVAVRMAWGQCSERYAEGKPYLPVLEALGQPSRGPNPQEMHTALWRYTPMWLAQLPGLLNEAELERLQRQSQGVTSTCMVRELAEALDLPTAEPSWCTCSKTCTGVMAPRRRP